MINKHNYKQYRCCINNIKNNGSEFMTIPNEKPMKNEEEFVFTALTESEIIDLKESMHRNHELMMDLA